MSICQEAVSKPFTLIHNLWIFPSNRYCSTIQVANNGANDPIVDIQGQSEISAENLTKIWPQ